MLGLTILIGYAFLGELIHYLFDLPLPGNVIGLILFVISLFTGLIKIEQVEEISGTILKHFSFFFIPVIVSILTVISVIMENVATIAVSLIGSTFIVLLTTGWIVKLSVKRNKQEKE